VVAFVARVARGSFVFRLHGNNTGEIERVCDSRWADSRRPDRILAFSLLWNVAFRSFLEGLSRGLTNLIMILEFDFVKHPQN